MRQKIWFGYTGVQKIRKRAEPHESQHAESVNIRYVRYGITGRTYHATMYDITAISREGAFVNRCDLENLRHARRSIRSRTSIKGIVRG